MKSAFEPPQRSSRAAIGCALGWAFLTIGCGESAQSPSPQGSGGSGAAGGSSGGTPGSGGVQAKGGGTGGGAGGAANGGQGGTNSSGSGGGSNGGTQAGGSGGGTATSGCSGKVGSLNTNPFGCDFAWGAEGNQGNRASYLQFITGWVGSEQQPNAQPNACYGCQLVQSIANTDAIPVFYGYIIGEAGHAAGLPDCNQGGPPNLCTHGAQMIRDNWDELVQKYGDYARRVYEISPNKPVVWLLEGDFIQYHDGEDQQNALSLAELGQLAEEITCAIKSNQPNAVVAMNHTTWNSDQETNDFWAAMPLEVLDLVWTTGVGDNDGYFSASTESDDYNATTANYAYVSNLTNRKLFVDISYGASQLEDSWTDQSASTLNQRIADGVIAVNAGTNAPGNYQSRINGLAPSLNGTCQ